jgi:hypothetical protein
MSCSRSLVVDTLPVQKQQAGAAWGKLFPLLPTCPTRHY